MALNTGKWVRRSTKEPIAYMAIKTDIDSSLLVRHAAMTFEVSDDGKRLVDFTTGRRISRASLERAILDDIKSHGTDRMDWDYDGDSFDVAKAEVKRLYPEWESWIEEVEQ